MPEGEDIEACSFLTTGEVPSLRPTKLEEEDSLRGEEFSRRNALGGIGAGGVDPDPGIGLGDALSARVLGDAVLDVFG